MNWFRSSDSPFIAVWHFYLLFLGIVLLVNIICFSIGYLLVRRHRKIYRKWLKDDE